MPLSAGRAKKILAGLMVLYLLLMGAVVLFRHYNFQTQTWDMGAFDQTFWNTVHGRIMQNSLEEVPNHLGVHMSPWIFLLVPGYALFPTPYFLLFIQTLALALGAWPLYLLAEQKTRNRHWALLLAAGYLLFPPLHWINFFDFHPIAFLVPLLFAALYHSETGRWRWALVWYVLAASTQEDAILVVFSTGLYFLWRGWRQHRSLRSSGARRGVTPAERYGVAVALFALLYFVLSVKVLMPAFGGGLLRLDRYAYLGSSVSEIVKTMVTNPVLVARTVFTAPKFAYLFWIFFPFLFLPFLSGSAFLVLVPGLAENLLTRFSFQFSSLYQYDSVLVAGLFFAALQGILWARRRLPRQEKWMQRLLAASFLIAFLFRSPLSPRVFPTQIFQSSNPHWETLRAMVKKVPPGVSVAASTNMVPHLTNREHVYLAGREPFAVDTLLLDGADLTGFRSPEEFQTYADRYALSGAYEIDNIQDRYFVFRRKK